MATPFNPDRSDLLHLDAFRDSSPNGPVECNSRPSRHRSIIDASTGRQDRESPRRQKLRTGFTSGLAERQVRLAREDGEEFVCRMGMGRYPVNALSNSVFL